MFGYLFLCTPCPQMSALYSLLWFCLRCVGDLNINPIALLIACKKIFRCTFFLATARRLVILALWSWLDAHPRGGALGEGPRGGFWALIRAGRRHRAVGGKGPPQGGTTGNGAHSDESAPQHRKTGVYGLPEGRPNATALFLGEERARRP